MKIVVYDPNTSKNEWKFYQVFFIMKNWQKKYKNIVQIVCSKQDWSKRIIKKFKNFVCKIAFWNK